MSGALAFAFPPGMTLETWLDDVLGADEATCLWCGHPAERRIGAGGMRVTSCDGCGSTLEEESPQGRTPLSLVPR